MQKSGLFVTIIKRVMTLEIGEYLLILIFLKYFLSNLLREILNRKLINIIN